MICHVLAGVPGVGKDWFAKNEIGVDDHIISYDQIRVDVFLRECNISKDDIKSDELYHKAWQYCNDNKVNLDHYLILQAKEFYKNNIDFAIANTNTNKKARKKMVNILRNVSKDITISCWYLMAPRHIIHERNEARASTDKKIPYEVVERFINNQSIPGFDEGFDFISIEYNI